VSSQRCENRRKSCIVTKVAELACCRWVGQDAETVPCLGKRAMKKQQSQPTTNPRHRGEGHHSFFIEAPRHFSSHFTISRSGADPNRCKRPFTVPNLVSAYFVEGIVWSTCGNDGAETNLNRDSSGRNDVVDGFGSSIVVYHRIDWHPAHVSFPNDWPLFLMFPFLDVLLFGRWMSIIYINSFSVCLRDRDGSVTSHILGPQTLAYDAFRGQNVWLNMGIAMYWYES
jgi:hypothetical protein